ncbi:MAG TPA: proton-conducting transporter membrane subunit, partial [Egibacteraceae bacterium]|nr:proton-conducting transporter membrane subunit [Egibacteraceae bacterium]
MLFALLALHAALALLAPAIARRLGRGVFLVCGLAPAATVAWALTAASSVIAGAPLAQTLRWAPSLGLQATLRLDAFALVMVALVSGIGTLIFAYSARYFSPRPDLGRFTATLTAFAGAMLGLVLADNLLLLYVFWELTSITSYLLIGFEDTKGSARAAALQALLITAAGGLAMLGGFVLLGQSAGTYSLAAIVASPPAGGLIGVAVALILLGAFTKSAQAPFHMWLPAAMEAPTPVSAYLHSATMVKAGVYLIARLGPAMAVSAALWRPAVVIVGVATMLLGGYRALRQYDLKLLLAFGTISQLGLMVVLLGIGRPEATAAGVLLLLAHGAFKATLFMVTGVIDHQTGTRDVRRLSGLGRRTPVLFAVAAVAAASMAGLPPLLGFVAKESVYEALLHGGGGVINVVALAGVALGSVLTFAYSVRFLHGAFADKRADARRDAIGPEAPRARASFVAPAALLAVFTLVVGALPEPLSPLVGAAGRALDSRVSP